MRFPGGGLRIQSPESVDAGLRDAPAQLSPVRHVRTPSLWHNECLATLQSAYPDAHLHGTPGMAEENPALLFSHVPSDTPHPDWSTVITQHLVRGMPRMNEVPFPHRPADR